MTFRHLQTTTLFFLAVLFGMQDGLAKDTPRGFLLSESLGLIRAEQSTQLTDQALLSANAASVSIAYIKKQDLAHYTTAFSTGFIASNFKITKADNEQLTKVILERAKSSKRLVFLPWEKGELALFGAVSMKALSDEEIIIEALVCASDWKEAIKLENEKPEVALSKSAVWSSISRKKIRVKDLFVGDGPSLEAVLQAFLSLYVRDMAEVLLPSVENIVSARPITVAQEDRRIDSRLWKVGYQANNSTQQLTEFVLSGQTVESWQELFTRQLIADPERKVSIEKLAARIREGFTADCRNLQWNIVRQNDSEIIYRWSHEGCNAYQPQFEMARLSRTSRGICRWAFASRLVPVTAEVQEAYRSIVEKLECE